MEPKTLALRQRKSFYTKLRRQKVLHLMALPALASLVIFCYIPMFGLQISFKDYMFNKGILGSPWVGLKQFADFLTDPNIGQVLVNTVAISLLKVVFMFPAPILLALMLNEIRNEPFKRVTQTISYFPYFISWVIIALMAQSWFSTSGGFVNNFLIALGVLKQPYVFLGEPNAFWWIAVALDMWKNTGWASIIYLAAITGIDPSLYEAAEIDGAKKLRKILNITLPCISGTIIIMLILNIGSMLSGGLFGSNFSQSYLLGNPLNQPRSEILDTYILKMGISLNRFSYATAVGLLQGVVSFLMLLGANFSSKRLSGESFF